MAVQLIPESAVCLLMVSLAEVQYCLHCLLAVFVSFPPLLCLFFLSLLSLLMAYAHATIKAGGELSCH